ncbi:MAG: hypothetical protein A2172_01180 [Candidatus Woykebacteria bacterium RBG_13_40_15]|uniref:Uncharacterized protein n=1 Tax=Candidatus Woykebacteria bacterium RBG_13_40_15 TaxID=1802593 RepID=A0A1G1W9C0_9BACT|nr:MAG: hypothetical protein A2172_01180 [Candidatus Woykebacteria bacterium RBG_13_40_15]
MADRKRSTSWRADPEFRRMVEEKKQELDYLFGLIGPFEDWEDWDESIPDEDVVRLELHVGDGIERGHLELTMGELRRVKELAELLKVLKEQKIMIEEPDTIARLTSELGSESAKRALEVVLGSLIIEGCPCDELSD